MDRDGDGTLFSIDRKLFSSDLWFASPMKLKVFIYLLGKANWEPGEFKGVNIERGQIIRSYRTIAKDCGYYIGYRLKKPSVSSIKAICEELTKEGRIHKRTEHCGTLFTISNYSKLQKQLKNEPNRSPNSHRTVTEQKNNNIIINNNKNTYTSEFEQFWNAYPKKTGKKYAYRCWKQNGRPPLDVILKAIEKQKKSKQWTKDGGQFIPNPSTWLNQGRWEDDLNGYKKTHSDDVKYFLTPLGEGDK